MSSDRSSVVFVLATILTGGSVFTVILCLFNRFAVSLLNEAAAKGPIVKIPLGTIEGYLTKTVNGREYVAFEGIPYAKAPVGKRRFAVSQSRIVIFLKSLLWFWNGQEPQPAEEWKGVWQAKVPTKCIQYNHFTPPGSDYVIGKI